MSNQSLRQAAVRELTETALSYESDFHTMFDADGIATGPFNGRLLAWINEYLGASHTNLPGAQAAFAASLGFNDWNSVNTWDALAGPSNSVAPAITGDAIIGEELTVSDGTWSGNGTISYAYQWKRDGANIGSATANAYTLVEVDIGAMITCRVTATDDDGSRGANSNSVGPVEAVAPNNTVAPEVTGTEEVGETLSCSTGTWDGDPTPTFTYQWRRDGVAIGGATASTYELVEDDDGAMIDCVVTGTNVGGSDSQASNEVGPITTGGGGEEPWTGYFTAAGITNGTAQTAINTFFSGLATDSIQSKVKVFVITGGESATAKNVMSDAYHGSLVNSPTFTQWVGVRGDDATSYISTGTALGSITGLGVDSTTVGVFMKQDAPANGDSYNLPGYLYAESYAGPNSYEAVVLQPSFANDAGQEQYTLSPAVNDPFGGTSTAADWGDLNNVRFYASRTGATTIKAYKNTTEILSASDASEAFPGVAAFIGAQNYDGSPGFDGVNSTFDCWGYVIAEGLSGAEQALLDGRVATLRTALEAL
jgi:hypothetical protein